MIQRGSAANHSRNILIQDVMRDVRSAFSDHRDLGVGRGGENLQK
jgi:hypothetical protein